MRQFFCIVVKPKRRGSERDRDAQTLGRPSRDALHSWRELIGLGFGAAIGLWAEWWSGEVLIVLSGMLCTQDVSAMLSQKGAEDNAALDVGTCTGGAVTAAKAQHRQRGRRRERRAVPRRPGGGGGGVARDEERGAGLQGVA